MMPIGRASKKTKDTENAWRKFGKARKKVRGQPESHKNQCDMLRYSDIMGLIPAASKFAVAKPTTAFVQRFIAIVG